MPLGTLQLYTSKFHTMSGMAQPTEQFKDAGPFFTADQHPQKVSASEKMIWKQERPLPINDGQVCQTIKDWSESHTALLDALPTIQTMKAIGPLGETLFAQR